MTAHGVFSKTNYQQDMKDVNRRIDTIKAYNNDYKRPLDYCLIRCDRGLRTLFGGTYGYTRVAGGKPKFHGGIDLYAQVGSPCYAVHAGDVEWALDFGDSGWGKCVLIRFETPDSTLWALYAHLSELYVKASTRNIKSGMMIGSTGITGNADSRFPHLHFEVWTSTKAGLKGSNERYRINPANVLGTVPFVPFAEEVINYNTRMV